MNFFRLCVCVMVFFISQTNADDKHGSIEDKIVSVKILTSKLQTGQNSNLLVVFTIKNGWYLYNQDKPDTAPKINWKLPKGVTIQSPKWSIPVLKTIFDEEIKVHEGFLIIAYPCAVSQDFVPKSEIKADVSWVACNSQSCQPGDRTLLVEYSESLSAQYLSQLTDVANHESLRYVILMILFAFIGGLILNLMPCVLPVLSLKILKLTKDFNKRVMRLNGIFFTFGTLVGFWVLAGALFFFKNIGHEIGWGFQLQSPNFVICLIGVFFLLAMNLFGVFEFGSSFLSLSNKIKNHTSYLSSFLNGVLACVIATPCTAPFMGTTLGVALTQPWYTAFAIFSSLGLGMAFPFLAISYLPSYTKFLPKPGRWMETFKHFLGFCMVGSILWLLSVLITQTNEATLLSTVFGLALISFGCWILGRFAIINYSLLKRLLIKLLASLFIVFGFTSGIVFRWIEEPRQTDVQWIPYDQKVLEQLKEEGRTILIDFTATWCITCQFNKKFVLEKKPIVELIKKHKVVTMKADWTSKDGNITKALQSYGRNSVPLYALHIGKKEPIILPEILSESALIKAFNKLY